MKTARRDFSATSGSESPRRLTLVGMAIAPILIGGILAWALAAPVANLDRVTAAIVNDDEPVTVDGQSVPLGRQFAAALMAGSTTDSDSSPDASTFDWVLTNSGEAAAGLASGRYAAVVTIPEDFSADATSISGPAADARQASVQIETTPASAWLDPPLTSAVTQGAVDALNTQLISRYLGQVYDGFNTIDTQIASASEGAQQLATGAGQLASGADSLATGADELDTGLNTLSAGASSVAGGLIEIDALASTLPSQTAQLAQGSDEVSAAVSSASIRLDEASSAFGAVVAELCQTVGPLCDRAGSALAQLQAAAQDVDALAAGAGEVAAGNDALAAAMPSLVAAIGAAAGGSADVAAGAASSSAGADALASGAEQLSAGSGQVDAGADQLATGLDQAVEQIPTYSDTDIATLSSVVSRPVAVDESATPAGLQSAPLFTMLALWLGGLVIALGVQAVPTRRLLVNVGSGAIAVRAIALPAVLGSIQGAVVAFVVLGSVAVSPVQWTAFALGAAFVGAVFALANQGLAAAFGGAGRLIALAIALVGLAAGLSSTVPPIIETPNAGLPTRMATDLLLAALTGQAAAGWFAVGSLLITAGGAFVLVFAGVIARRRVSLPSPAG